MATARLDLWVDDDQRDEWDDACAADGPLSILQAMLDEQAPGLGDVVDWDVVQASSDGIVVRTTVETSNPAALREATCPLTGSPPDVAVFVWVDDEVASRNPTWAANLGDGELSELQTRN